MRTANSCLNSGDRKKHSYTHTRTMKTDGKSEFCCLKKIVRFHLQCAAVWCSEPVQRRSSRWWNFPYYTKENKMILVSLCKTMQTQFAYRSTQTRARQYWWALCTMARISDITTTTLQTIRVGSAQLVDRFHRYDCFSFVFFTSIENESRFGVFVPSRQYIFYFSCTISIDTVYIFFIMDLLCSLVRSALQVLTFSFNGFQQ